MVITVGELRKTTNVLLSYLEDQRIESVTLKVDYYWNIPADKVYDVTSTPSELDLGQLSDDWHELQRIAQGAADPIGYALVWLAAVMRAVGHEVLA